MTEFQGVRKGLEGREGAGLPDAEDAKNTYRVSDRLGRVEDDISENEIRSSRQPELTERIDES